MFLHRFIIRRNKCLIVTLIIKRGLRKIHYICYQKGLINILNMFMILKIFFSPHKSDLSVCHFLRNILINFLLSERWSVKPVSLTLHPTYITKIVKSSKERISKYLYVNNISFSVKYYSNIRKTNNTKFLRCLWPII